MTMYGDGETATAKGVAIMKRIVRCVLTMSVIGVFDGFAAGWCVAQLTHNAPKQACDQYVAPLDVEYGSKRPLIDAVGWLAGVPKKILLWDRRADNHDVSPQTVDDISGYLSYRRLSNVKIRVNQYDPVGNWNRLVQNKTIAPGWKYTLGTLKQIEYIFLPGRIFGGDEYNPFTNTLNVYSDMPTLGLAEAAYAYDVNTRLYPGTYSAAQSLPVVAIWHETLATDEIMTYAAIRGTSEQLDHIRQDLYARYGISLGGELGRVLPDGSVVFEVVGALAGHATASAQRSTVR